MRPQRRPVEIFSFSFLDVIACAVGVILFITILAISNVVKHGDPELIRQLEESLSTESTLERMQAELEENQRKQKEMEQALARVTELEQQVQVARGKSAVVTVYQQLREQYEAARAEFEQTKALSSIMPDRSPVARSTNKRPVLYLSFSGNGNVRMATQFSGGFSSEHYDVRESDAETVLKAEGPPAKVDQLMQPGGPLQSVLARMDKARHYVECYLEPDGFEDFVRLRTWLQVAGWDVGFMFTSDTSTLMYSYSGKSSKVQ